LKQMNKINSLKVLAVAGCAFAALNVHAVPISGSILFKGDTMTVDNSDLALAKAITGFSKATLLGGVGSYALSPADVGLGSWTPFTFSPSLSPNPLNPLWTFTLAGGKTYSFAATSVTIVKQDSGFLNLMGTGVAHIDGLEDTAGNWLLNTEGGRVLFAYNGGAVIGAAAGVPDGGVTVTLLGMAIGGLAFLRKKVS